MHKDEEMKGDNSCSPTRRLPIVNLTGNKKIHYHALMDYYESKIQCLLDLNMPSKLVRLACWDAPVDRKFIGTERDQRRFLKRCLKYYKKQLKEVKKKGEKI